MDRERELIDRCGAGDREAQRELYDRTVGRVFRVLARITHSEEAAFDLAQETYIRAFTHLASFDGRSSLATWLYRIAVNEALQFLRRRDRRPTFDPIDSANLASHNTAGRGDIVMDINEALARLDEIDRAALTLRYQEGLDYRAIAEVLSCAEGTVASRLNRARQRLREILGADYGLREEIVARPHQS